MEVRPERIAADSLRKPWWSLLRSSDSSLSSSGAKIRKWQGSEYVRRREKGGLTSKRANIKYKMGQSIATIGDVKVEEHREAEVGGRRF